MALTRDFKETILARAQRDARFRQALFTEAINAYLAGDTPAGKAILRDLVNATVGFEALAAASISLPRACIACSHRAATRVRRTSLTSSARCRKKRASNCASRQRPREHLELVGFETDQRSDVHDANRGVQ